MSGVWYKPAASAEECAAHMEAGGLVEYQTRSNGWRSPCMTTAEWFRDHPDYEVDAYRLAYPVPHGTTIAAPTVDVPQPLTRDGVLAAVKAIEDAGGKAVVEWMDSRRGEWGITHRDDVKRWINPDVPRWNVRVRAVEVETEDVPLTQLVGLLWKATKP